MAVDYWALGCIIFELELEGTRVSAHRLTFLCFSPITITQTLFETMADLKAYQKYRPALHGGKSYLDAFALGEDAEDLILGVCFYTLSTISGILNNCHQLVRVSPVHRSGEEICRHSYFKTTNGYVCSHSPRSC